MEEHAAHRLLGKLRSFIAEELDPDEREVLAVLLAPGVARAHEEVEVAGFGMGNPAGLPDLPHALVAVLQRERVRVEGLGL